MSRPNPTRIVVDAGLKASSVDSGLPTVWQRPDLEFARISDEHGVIEALVLRRAQLILNPGMVGLTILDSLIAGVPMVTCDLDFHSPEIAYLHDGRNGLVTADDVGAYADGVVGLLSDGERLARMRAACLEDAQEYTMTHMVERFCDGVVRALAAE